jgi:hypothetical protein
MDILRREIARINNQVSWMFWAIRLRALTAGIPRLEIAHIDDQMSRIFFAMRFRTKLRALTTK